MCDVCHLSFNTSHGNAKVCSKECKKKKTNRMYGREKYLEGIAPGTVGAIAEMVVAVDLMRKGYNVFRALSPSCFCDLIVEKMDKVLRIEVRTGYQSQTGNIVYPKIKHGQKGKLLDVFAVYCGATNEIFYFDIKFKKYPM